MASVSRLGEATDPVSRWSRPMTIGACTLPFCTSQLNRSPISARSPYSSQQIRAGSPWKWIFSRACRIQRPSDSLSGNVSSTARSVTAMSAASPESAAQRKGPAPRQKSGRMYSGTKPGNPEGFPHTAVVGHLAPQVVAVVERHGPAGLQVQHGLHVHRIESSTRDSYPEGSLARSAAAASSEQPAGM